MKHHTINGKTADDFPDPRKGASPMNEALFVQPGGTVITA